MEAADAKQALITTQGSGTGNAANTLLLYDDNQDVSQKIRPILFPPPPPTPTQLPAITIGRPVTSFRGKLIRTPDGRFIVGMTSWNNNTNTYLFVYEIASATLLRSRNVTGQSTILSISPDGSRFMAGYTLYDTATLSIVAQQNIANAPFAMPGAFSTVNNVGGSTFSADGATLYSAFNTAANTQPPPRPQASILLISSTDNLAIRLGINIPESI
ncbi:MAG: hypothetical protein NTY38_15885, partial [Acidobacteria bacterium]|nr:hypothetical protein [Acidobacteriota bacterium]